VELDGIAAEFRPGNFDIPSRNRILRQSLGVAKHTSATRITKEAPGQAMLGLAISLLRAPEW